MAGQAPAAHPLPMTVPLVVLVLGGWVVAALAVGLLLCRAICWARGADEEPAAVAAAAPGVAVPGPRAHSDGAPVSAPTRLDA